jgi:predicted ATP-binding protein involved in virulence
MKIVSFSCEKVHGYLTFKTTFNQGLTFLTGINGSGKTTAVRSVIALLTPSIKELANISYKNISVTVSHRDRKVVIYSSRTEEGIILGCSSSKESLLFPVFKPEPYESRGRFLEREHNFYREQEAVNSAHPVLIAIDALPTPMYLDLERRYQVGARKVKDEIFVARSLELSNPLAGSLMDSINDAQKLAESIYRHALSRRSQLTDILKQNIILTAFELDTDFKETVFDLTSPSWSLDQINEIERIVIQSLRQIGIREDRLEQTVSPFFSRVRDVARDFPSSEEIKTASRNNAFDSSNIIKRISAWSAIKPQVRQINRLRELIEKYNEQVRRAFEPIERYRNSINRFLEDSRKSLVFTSDGSLKVKINGYENGQIQPLGALSSGERQLVVILTHLAFNNQASVANVLIIDEPELSLHLRWQELFVDAVIEASPHLQMILATHSPSIIKSRIDDCVDVQEAYVL